MAVWKKAMALTLCGIMAVSVGGCSGSDTAEDEIEVTEGSREEQEAAQSEEAAPEEETTEVLSDLEATISWWTYPIFVQDDGEADGSYEQKLIAEFNQRYPNITVELTMLDYTNGPTQVEDAIAAEGGVLPNVLLDEPGRILSYAKDGVLADLSGLYEDGQASSMVSEGIMSACRLDGTYYIYPLSASNYVMVFNKAMLEDSGAMELMNLEGDRAWTTETFEQVLQRLSEAGCSGGSLYCSGIAGDYGTRSFITNLYDGSLMNEDKSAYTMDSEANRQALTKIREWMEAGWIQNGSGFTGADAVNAFVNGETSYCLLWSLPQELSNAQTLQDNGIETVVVPYPSADGVPTLEYMLNGFCIFSTEDEAKSQASQYLIDFLCNDEAVAAENVVRSGAFPVQTTLGDVYAGNEEAQLYEALLPHSGTYYNKNNGFEVMRIYWYQMESEILNGENSVDVATANFSKYATESLSQTQESE